MGLFDIFKHKNDGAFSNSSNPFSKHINIDIINLLDQSTISMENCNEDGSIKYIDYKIQLPTLVLNTFDLLRIRIFSENKNINKNVLTNLSFSRKSKLVSLKQAKYVVNSIMKCCNVKDDNWTIADSTHLSNGDYWRGRTHFIDTDMVSIEWDEENFTLHIGGYQRYLK